MRRSAIAAAFFFLLVVGVHRSVVFEGKSLVHSNFINPFDFRALPESYGNHVVPHTEWANRNLTIAANIRDPGATWWQWEPSTKLLKDAIARGEWPFWDPYVAAGTPAMANLVPAFFFPPYLLMVLLGGSVTLKNAYFLFLLWSAAFLTFLFLQRHGLGMIASLFGGAAVMVGGSMTQNLGAFAGQTAACTPLALYVTRIFLDAPTRRRAAGVALIYAGIALASFPPLLLGVFGVAACYTFVAIGFGDCGGGVEDRWTTARLWLTAVVLAVGLVAWYYLPAIVLGRAVPHVSEMYRGAGLETMPVRNIYQLLSPTLMGGVQVYQTAPFASPGFAAHIPYIGIVCLLAATLAWPRSTRERTLIVAMAAASLIIFLKLVGAPPVQWIGYLPSFNQIHFSHYLGVPFGFPLVFLAAAGIEEIVRGRVSTPRALFASALAIAAVGSLWWIARINGAFAMENASYWIRDWKYLTIFAAASIVLLLTATVGKRASVLRVLGAAALGGVLIAEGMYNGTYPRPARWDVFEHPVRYIRLLRSEARMSRVMAFGQPAANTNEAYRIFGIDSLMAFNPPRIYQLYQRYMKPQREVFMRVPGQMPPDLVLDRLNTSFISTYTPTPAIINESEARGYERRFADGLTTLFKRETLPRFFFSSEYRVLPAATVLDAIATAPRREILLEDDPRVPIAPNTAGDPDVEVVAYRLNRIELDVEAPRPGLVYASESYFDGWTATVNDAPARILPANYAFRAIAVPLGRSRITFTYWPPGLTVGMVIAIISAALVAAMFLKPPRLDTRT